MQPGLFGTHEKKEKSQIKTGRHQQCTNSRKHEIQNNKDRIKAEGIPPGQPAGKICSFLNNNPYQQKLLVDQLRYGF